jgi:hypothetical protein
LPWYVEALSFARRQDSTGLTLKDTIDEVFFETNELRDSYFARTALREPDARPSRAHLGFDHSYVVGPSAPFSLRPDRSYQRGSSSQMEAYGWAAAIVSGISAVSWVVVSALRRVPVVCREAKKAVRAIRELVEEIRGPQRREINPPQSADE